MAGISFRITLVFTFLGFGIFLHNFPLCKHFCLFSLSEYSYIRSVLINLRYNGSMPKIKIKSVFVKYSISMPVCSPLVPSLLLGLTLKPEKKFSVFNQLLFSSCIIFMSMSVFMSEGSFCLLVVFRLLMKPLKPL